MREQFLGENRCAFICKAGHGIKRIVRLEAHIDANTNDHGMTPIGQEFAFDEDAAHFPAPDQQIVRPLYLKRRCAKRQHAPNRIMQRDGDRKRQGPKPVQRSRVDQKKRSVEIAALVTSRPDLAAMAGLMMGSSASPISE